VSIRNAQGPGAATRNGLPEARPYVYRGGDARREAEVQRILAAVRAELGGEPDIGPGPEWYRELEAERQELAAPVPVCAPVPPAPAAITLPALPAAVPPVPVPAAPRQPEPARAEPPGPERCPRCTYMTSAIAHKLTCGAGLHGNGDGWWCPAEELGFTAAELIGTGL
jgi:hypothetical protein